MRIIGIEEPVFHTQLDVYICDGETFEMSAPKILNYDVDTFGKDAMTATYYMDNGALGFLVWLKTFKGAANDYGNLSHEFLHVVQFLFESNGVSDNESSAYLLGYYIESFLTQWRKKNEKIRKARRKSK